MSYRNGAVVAILLLAGLPAGGCATILSSLDSSVVGDSSTPADGLREALRVATGRAVESLGRTDGFLANDLVRIEVPEKLRSVETALRAARELQRSAPVSGGVPG